MKSFPSLTFLLALFIALPTAASGQDQPPTDEQIAKLQQEADALVTQRNASAEQLAAKQQQLTDLQTQKSKLQGDVKKAEELVGKEAETLKPLQEAVTAAEGEKTKADEALAAAQKAAEDAKGSDQEKPKAEEAAKADAVAKAAAEKLQQAQAALQKTQADLQAAKDLQANAPAQLEQLDQQIAAVTTELDTMRQAHEQLAATTLTKLKEHEAALISVGRLVSFADKVAPIFAQRCLACHNARTAKGRYNMENFAAIMKGGESGAAVDPGNGELSTLYIMIEDGSMPKDADPLTKEEMAIVKHWIDTGAKLDAGVEPSAELIAVMPKLPQPLPPEKYKVPVPVTALAFSPDGNLLASSGYHEVLLWNTADGTLVRRITDVAERVYDIEFSQDGQTLAVAAGTPAQIGEAKLFQVADGKLLADFVRTGDSVFGVAFSPDGTKLACCGADRSIRIYDLASHKEVVTIEDHADWVIDVAWSPDGSKLASASRDKTSKIFDAQSGDSLVTFNSHGNTVSGVAFTADGNQVVTGGADKQLRIWNVADAKQARNIGGFGDEVFRVIVTPEGDIFSVSADKNARLHAVADGKAKQTFSGHQDWVYSLARHPGSKRIATGSYDGQIRIWNEADAQVQQSWTAAPGLEAQQAAAN